MEEQLLDTWRIHNRITLYLLDAIDPVAFATPTPKKGRSFVQMFAHIHNVRLMWLESAAADLMQSLTKIDKNDEVSQGSLHQTLAASAQAIELLLAQSFASGKRISGFKPHTPAFLAYLIAHESYHHGEIGIELARIGHPLDKRTAFGMWEWGSR
jgi:uncharacterized damage-inducible protein DinB